MWTAFWGTTEADQSTLTVPSPSKVIVASGPSGKSKIELADVDAQTQVR